MASNVFQILTTISDNINELKAVLAPLAALAQGTAGADASDGTKRGRRGRPKNSGAAGTSAAKTAMPGRKKRAFSADAQAIRRQAGAYGALLRQLPEGQRDQVRKLKEREGYSAAINLAEKLRNRVSSS